MKHLHQRRVLVHVRVTVPVPAPRPVLLVAKRIARRRSAVDRTRASASARTREHDGHRDAGAATAALDAHAAAPGRVGRQQRLRELGAARRAAAPRVPMPVVAAADEEGGGDNDQRAHDAAGDGARLGAGGAVG